MQLCLDIFILYTCLRGSNILQHRKSIFSDMSVYIMGSSFFGSDLVRFDWNREHACIQINFKLTAQGKAVGFFCESCKSYFSDFIGIFA